MILSTHGVLASQIASFDADAVAFFTRVTTAGGSLSNTEKVAVNQLVLDMKSAGIWSAMKAVYPMVGASSAACKQNLVSSSFTGTFSTGWTFASTGITGNGTSAYMNTTLAPSGNLSLNSSHLSYYSRTDNRRDQVEIGIGDFTGAESGLYILSRTIFGIYHANNSKETNSNMTDYSDSRGFFINNRVSSSAMSLFRNNVKQTDSSNNTTFLSNLSIYVGAQNSTFANPRLPSNRECAFASIGDGLTDTQASNLYTAVQAFNTTLSRQV